MPTAKNRNPDVDTFLDRRAHPERETIDLIRHLVLSISDEITEQIKWNGPSFCIDGDDRLTMRLAPKGDIQMIFHCGAKGAADKVVDFEDTTGRMTWPAPNRGVLTLGSRDDILAEVGALTDLFSRWIYAAR
ncbi:DUF1801 domain-containing protein [Kordiimonas sp.]|uniref:DUF1801 domain-containing protein n=1 Tax=Kordiimonas sp. TaxID=1970157 RepID=UPI003A8E8BA9